MGKIETSIDALFEGDAAISSDAVEMLVEKTTSNFQMSEKKVYQRFLGIVVIWVATIVTTSGKVSELSLLGAKLTDVTFFQVFLPFVASVLFYGMFAAFAGMVINLFSLRKIVTKAWPAVSEQKLEELLLPASFITIEIFVGQYMEGVSEKLDLAFKIILFIVLVFVPLGLLIHVHYVVLASPLVTMWMSIILICGSLVLVSRGVLLAFHLIDKFGD